MRIEKQTQEYLEFVEKFHNSLKPPSESLNKKLDRIEQFAKDFNKSELLLQVMMLKINIMGNSNQYKSAQKLIKEGHTLIQDCTDARAEAELNNIEGGFYFKFNEYAKALACYQKSFDYYSGVKDEIFMCRLAKNLGVCYFRNLDYKNSYIYLKQSLQLAEQMNLLEMKGIVLSWMGIFESELSSFELATKYLTESNQIFLTLDHKNGISNNMNSIGLIYLRWNKLDDALDVFLKAKKIARQAKAKITLADIYHNLGMLYRRMKKNKESLAAFNTSVKIREKSGNPEKMANTLNSIANVYASMKKYDLAMEFYDESLKIRKKLKLYKHILRSYINYAVVYLEMGNLKSALKYGKKALTLNSSLSQTELMELVYKFFADYHRVRGNYKKAYEFYMMFIEEKEIYFNEQSNKTIINMQNRFELDLLKKQLEEKLKQEKINTELAMAVTTNHEINQPLMIIQGNIDLIDNLLEFSGNPDKYKKIINRINDNITSIQNAISDFSIHSGITVDWDE